MAVSRLFKLRVFAGASLQLFLVLPCFSRVQYQIATPSVVVVASAGALGVDSQHHGCSWARWGRAATAAATAPTKTKMSQNKKLEQHAITQNWCQCDQGDFIDNLSAKWRIAARVHFGLEVHAVEFGLVALPVHAPQLKSCSPYPPRKRKFPRLATVFANSIRRSS